MLAQPRILRQAEHVTQPEPVAQVQNLGRAIMAVGAQQNLGPGPMTADLPDQTPDMGGGLLAGRAAHRAQHCPNKTSLAIKDHDRLKAVFIVIGVEQAQLLVAVDGIEGVVDVEYDLSGRAGKGSAIKPHHLMSHPDQGPGVGQVFHTRDRGLRAQRRPGLGTPLESELERRVIPQIIRVIAILISGGNHHDPKPDDVPIDTAGA